MSKKPIVALMYDFDKTLSPKNMQEYGFIPKLGSNSKAFWDKCNEQVKKNSMDKILAYMHQMIKQSADKMPITREAFVEQGKSIELFPGVEDWFDRINMFGAENDVIIEHYILSSGLKEFIEGTKISKKFKRIYACEFCYDENGVAVWPALSVNYTSKTQFLFRINKGILDVTIDDELNSYTPESDRPVPFSNMIYIGDGLTDVPCMKLVKVNGGHSIAVFQKRKKHDVSSLILDGRVNFLALADYSENSEIDIIVKSLIKKVASDSIIKCLSEKHYEMAKRDNIKKIK